MLFERKLNTEIGLKDGTWLREVCSCSCLPVLPGPARVLLSKICILFLPISVDFQLILFFDAEYLLPVLSDLIYAEVDWKEKREKVEARGR